MNSFNNIKKVKYTKSEQDVVSLKEYIIFTDDRKNEKYLVFKFVNNLNQKLYDLQFEIVQYNENNEIIAKSTVVYDNFKADENEEFVPKAKLLVEFDCVNIRANLVSARFERVKWENNKFKEVPFKFAQYKDDIKKKEKAKKEKAEKVVTSKRKGRKAKEDKLDFSITDVSANNKPKGPHVFKVVSCVSVVAFLAVSLFIFAKTEYGSHKFTSQGIDYRIVTGNTVNVCGYDEKERDIVIPSHVTYENSMKKKISMEVVKIEENAFLNSKLTAVHFQSDLLTIEENAFYGCNKLVNVNGNNEIQVERNAFKYCPNIKNITLPKAVLNEKSFNGSLNVETLIYDECNAETLISVFTDSANKSMNFNSIETNEDELLQGFLDGIKTNQLIIDENKCRVEYGVYELLDIDGYFKTDSYELSNGEVISVNKKSERFVVDSNIISFDTLKFSNELSYIKELEIDSSNFIIDRSFISRFSNLETLYIKDYSNVDPFALSGTNVKTLKTSIPWNIKLSDFVSNAYNLSTIEIVDTQYINGDDLAYIVNVNNLVISEDVISIDKNAFNGSYFRNVRLPHTNNVSQFNKYNGLNYVETVEIFPSSNSNISYNYFANLPYLKELVIEEGFSYIDSSIATNSNNLRRFELGKASNVSAPLLDFTNIYLDTLVLDCSNNSFSSLNNLVECTNYLTSVSLKNVNISNSQFFEGCESIINLSISGDIYAVNSLLANLKNLSYLSLETNSSIGSYFSDFFNDKGSVDKNKSIDVPINTVVVNGADIPNNYFMDCKSLRTLAFIDVKSFGENAFSNVAKLYRVYFSNSCNYNSNSALHEISVIKNINVYFEGEEPKNDTDATYHSYANIEEFLYDFN